MQLARDRGDYNYSIVNRLTRHISWLKIDGEPSAATVSSSLDTQLHWTQKSVYAFFRKTSGLPTSRSWISLDLGDLTGSHVQNGSVCLKNAPWHREVRDRHSGTFTRPV